MIETGSPAFPTAKDDDDDDVAWALSTALVQWKRGAVADAVTWLRRAVDSAVSVGASAPALAPLASASSLLMIPM